MILHPSLASADPLRYAEALTALHDAPLGSLHLDIEDTSFINNITFGMKTIQAVAQYTRHPLSFHLMVSSPQRWLPWLAAIRPGWIFIHAESVQNPSEILADIRAIGAKAGLALNPATPLLPYRYLALQLDALMIMTSEPDGRGQQFIAAMCEKVSQNEGISLLRNAGRTAVLHFAPHGCLRRRRTASGDWPGVVHDGEL